MAAGESLSPGSSGASPQTFFRGNHSRIVEAITEAETHTTGEIRVHLSRRWWEPNPLARARKIFSRLTMQVASGHNAVLLYVNLRRKKFAIFGGEGIHSSVGQKYWHRIARELAADMRATHYENAIAGAVAKIGQALAEHFPADAEHPNLNELPNDVTED